jgi:hypothetical protein
MELFELEDLETTTAPAGTAGAVVIEIIFVVVFL